MFSFRKNPRRLAAVLTGLAAFTATSLRGAPTRPNILFILADDHTSQAWGVYPSILTPVIDNPNIRRLTREGTLLQQAFCANSICTPSRATILTGQYSHHNDVYTMMNGLDPAHRNVAQLLQAAGYQTAIFGKWHLHYEPSGFDTFRVLPGQGRYHDPLFKGADNWQDGDKGGTPIKGFSTDVIGDLCLDWLAKRNPARPFMLMCHFKATHEPFDYAPRYAHLYDNVEMPEPPTLYEFGPGASGRNFSGQTLEILGDRYEEKASVGFDYPGKFDLPPGISEHERRHLIYQKFVKDFLRSGRGIDDNIGRLLQYLDDAGLAKDTIVIYTADQGYFLGEHGFFDKRMMYEEPLRMPFVIRYPVEVRAGARLDDMVQNIDFAPLLLDYAGLKESADMDGRSFRANLAGHTPEGWRQEIYYRYWQQQKDRPAHFGIRSRTDKLIRFYGRALHMDDAPAVNTPPAWEYYDLTIDPHETKNRFTDPVYQDRIKTLQHHLADLKQQVGDLE